MACFSSSVPDEGLKPTTQQTVHCPPDKEGYLSGGSLSIAAEYGGHLEDHWRPSQFHQKPKHFIMLNFNFRLYIAVILDTGLEKYMVSHQVASQG